MPEPTADGELKSAAMHESRPEKRTGHTIAPEPESHRASDQVCELATLWRLLVEFEGMEEDPAHTPTTEAELQLASANVFLT